MTRFGRFCEKLRKKQHPGGMIVCYGRGQWHIYYSVVRTPVQYRKYGIATDGKFYTSQFRAGIAWALARGKHG